MNRAHGREAAGRLSVNEANASQIPKRQLARRVSVNVQTSHLRGSLSLPVTADEEPRRFHSRSTK
jgi:hypothetical protein